MKIKRNEIERRYAAHFDHWANLKQTVVWHETHPL
jgi:hypothetical protein